ncbi:MAG TPA: 5-(carboxyamino)imidazole ribonucleotide synthase [Xanthomonadaceae bacterium]|nr:5-(carboxyamino)imidazole ribonucleotide synthase [Xanthomonadaceae bacterium]
MKTVGILGGGQLARMMVLAGVPLGLRFLVLDPSPDACAGQVAPLLVGRYDDPEVLAEFAGRVDVATFDFENVPAASVEWLAERLPVHPQARALAVSQDRVSEKSLFRELGIPVPEFFAIATRDDLDAAMDAVGVPCIVKTRRFGYDGKGQFRIRTRGDADAAWSALGAQADTVGLIAEAFVPFDRELSVLAVRSAEGEFRAWPLTRNWHVDGVLSVSLAPAPDVTAGEADAAIAHAERLAEHLGYVGVFALELFDCGGRLLANEMAPRVHNSGHWTIEGAETSQFENHIRAVLGLPLGSTRPKGLACMLNWLGELPDALPCLASAGGHWHDYGKSPRAGRKVGHATFRACSASDLAAVLADAGAEWGRAFQVQGVLHQLTR